MKFCNLKEEHEERAARHKDAVSVDVCYADSSGKPNKKVER